MPVIAKKYTIRFEEKDLCFSETYPMDLEGILPVAEFDSVVRRVNEDMTSEIRKTSKDVRNWAIATISLCIVVVGLFLTPVLYIKTNRQKKELKQFWERLRVYFGEINRKTYLKRSLEWKLVDDQKKLKGRDVVNPLFAYRIELIHRTTTKRPKSQLLGPGLSMTAVAAGSSGSRLSTLSTTSAGEAFSTSEFLMGTRKSSSSGSGPKSPTDKSTPSTSDEEFEDEQQGALVMVDSAAVAPSTSSKLADDIVFEEEDEDEGGDLGDEDLGNLASVSSVGAGSYSRGSLIITPMDLVIAAQEGKMKEMTEKAAPIEPESKIGSEKEAKMLKKSSRVRFSGIFINEEDGEEDEDEDRDGLIDKEVEKKEDKDDKTDQ